MGARGHARSHAPARPRRAVSDASVAGCCDPRGCDDFFGDKFARRVAKRYRKRGLDKTSRRIVAFLERAGVQEATVLEIGGGVGEIQLELLKLGAASAVEPRALAGLRRRGAPAAARGRDRRGAGGPPAARHRGGSWRRRVGRRRRAAPRRLLLPRLRAAARAPRRRTRGARSCSAIRRATSPRARSSRSQNVALRLGPQGVPHVRPPAVGDARRVSRSRPVRDRCPLRASSGRSRDSAR